MIVDIFSPEFLSALLSIVMIDLILAGDNAIVIGMAARNLPKENQKKVIIWGTVGAILIRSTATLAVVWLLKIPGLLLAGGLLLIWMAYKLLVEEKKHDRVEASDNFWTAVRTIIIADAVMGIDNVLAVAGAAHNDYLLVILGLAISVPIVVWGSTMVLKAIDKFPVLIYLGAGTIAYTAAKMIRDEPFLKQYFVGNAALTWSFTLLIIAGVLLAGWYKKTKRREQYQR